MAKLDAIDLIGREPWCIEPGALERIVAIAQRLNDTPEAVATRLGRPLDNARTVETFGPTAVIPITGPIFRYANLFTEISGATSLEILARDFQAALDDPVVQQIVLSIDSPGGQSTGIAEFAGLVRASAKPVTAYVGDLAASAAYWIASAAGEIVASPTAMLGSIGVVMTYQPPPDRPGEKPKVEVVSSISPAKRLTPDTEAGRTEAQRIVDHLAEVFVADVAIGRAVSHETVIADFGAGSLLVGARAIAAGMADRIATLHSLTAGAPGFTSTRPFAMTNQAQTPGAPTIDRAYLNVNHPDLVSALLAEGQAQGLAAGAEAERTRIAAVREQLVPGHEALIERLAMDGKTTGPEAAVAVLQAEKALRLGAQQALASAPPPVAAAVPPLPSADKSSAAVTILANRRLATGKGAA
jgi:ClpP class serine protease